MHSYRSTPEVALSSGDYEAYPAPTLPPARVPVFARQAPPHQDVPPPVWGWDPRNDPRVLAAPVAPGSLAPVAMGQHSAATGSIRAVVSEPEKSSTKWGVMIAVTGAILGGVLGIMMNNGALSASGPNPAVAAQNAMEAAQLPANPQPVPQPMQSPAAQAPAQPAVQAVQAPAQPPVQINTAPAAPVQHATKDEPKDKHEKKGHHHAAASTHHHAPAPAAPVARSHTKPIVAASVPDAPREKPAKKDKEEKAEKPAKSTETNAAVDLLKQANKETSFSLGGSK